MVDPALVGAAQAGDALALDELLDELLPMVRRLTTAVAPSVAEDATQEALLAIFRNLSELRNPEAIVAWTRKLTNTDGASSGPCPPARPAPWRERGLPGRPGRAADRAGRRIGAAAGGAAHRGRPTRDRGLE